MEPSTQPGSDARADIVRTYRPIGELVPAHWEQGDIPANGITQRYYRTGGDRPAVVLLHGFMEGALAWLPTARTLEPDYDVVMLDARGHGDSARVAGDFAADVLVADAAAAITALGLQDVRLLGFSQGAATAALLTDRHPDLIRGVILAGLAEGGAPAGDMLNAPGYREWLAAYTAWLAGLKTQNHTERMLASLSQIPPFAPIPSEDEYVAWVENSAKLDLDMVGMGNSMWETLAETVQAQEAAIARLRCPALLMKSAASPVSSGPLTLREEASEHPNVTILHFENTGHLIYRDRFETFISQTRAFFARI
ncbi:MAG: alpha/beta hydrolase [Chloroflexales bacterium]|nr:alpha/beta hydrolase [Chloroflexales bacterium]